MKIGLIDVDGHNFPNLVLMKLSAWHKAQGDSVELILPMDRYDRVYMSKVFDFTPDYNFQIQADEVIKGGTGYDIKAKLPDEIESMCPDYSLYNTKDTAYGFCTRGCPRNCDFCSVTQKEGSVSKQVSELSGFWRGQKLIKLMDPNLLACKDRMYLLDELIKCKAKIDITQGFDVRLMTDDIADKINRMKLQILHFAWDNYEFKTYGMLKKMRPLLDYDVRKLKVYVLTNFNTTWEQDLERIYKLKELGYHPYVMIYDKYSFIDNNGRLKPMDELLKNHTIEQVEHFVKVRQAQRWTNPYIWFSGNAERFEDYIA